MAVEERLNRPRGPSRKQARRPQCLPCLSALLPAFPPASLFITLSTSNLQIKRMRRRIWEAHRNGKEAPDEGKLADMERERAEARRRRSPTMGYATFRRATVPAH